MATNFDEAVAAIVQEFQLSDADPEAAMIDQEGSDAELIASLLNAGHAKRARQRAVQAVGQLAQAVQAQQAQQQRTPDISNVNNPHELYRIAQRSGRLGYGKRPS